MLEVKMQIKQFILVAFTALFLSACATKGTVTFSETDHNVKTDKAVTTTESFQASQGTMKYLKRSDLAAKMCGLAGDRYKDFLVLSDTNVEFMPIVIQDGKYIDLPFDFRFRALEQSLWNGCRVTTSVLWFDVCVSVVAPCRAKKDPRGYVVSPPPRARKRETNW